MLASGCSAVVDGDAIATPGEEGKRLTNPKCNSVTVPLMEVPLDNDSEPRVEVPQPAGWERVKRFESGVVRIYLAATNLQSNGFVPNATVAIANLTGKASNEDAAFAAERSGLESFGVTDLVEAAGTICGYPSKTLTYNMGLGPIPSHRVTTTLVAVKNGSKVFTIGVSVQALDDTVRGFDTGRETILSGLQVSPPAIS
ncbi:LpqN/LpqT family lipoprotein [Mycobacteroides sp. LB1]|uniref:LpqN/LpqT family lipoprotein n=1 Tax=Mycobacteroides sp. LB1 TaxID=2750814 RepID=UPI0015DD80D1|nr:LpqN/LpqT family lipoprotein [Mycobacteroides sp. LB1]